MKKLAAIILTAVMLVTAFASALPAAAVTHGFLWGDANDDGDVNAKDVLLSRRFIAGLAEDADIFFKAADVVTDEDVNAKDVLKLRRTIAGLEDAEENNTDGAYKIDEIKIGGRNVARYTIIYPALSNIEDARITAVAFAASELQKYVNDACGIKLNIAYTGDKNVTGYVIEYSFDEELGQEGFAIEAKDDGNLSLRCGTRRAAAYATYTFLEDCVGYRFLSDSVTYLYKAATVDVPSGYFDEEIPTLEYRGIGTHIGKYFPQMKVNASDGGANDASKNGNGDYNASKIGGAVGTTYIHAHSFVYFEARFENRNDPNLDSVAGGKQMCMTSEASYAKIMDFLYKQVEWRTNDAGQIPGFHYTQISCSANDNSNFCTCANCKRAYDEEGAVSGALIRLCNRVADEFCAKYPMLDIYTAAYAGAHVPPKMTRPDPRVCVCFCCSGCNNHLLRHADECTEAGGNPRLQTQVGYEGPMVNQNNELWMGYLKEWLELTDNVYYWYYTDNWSFYVSPAPNIYNFWDDIKYLTELGVKGFYLEGDADYVNYTTEQLRNYMMSKVMWHPEMTEEEYSDLVNEYLMIYYGDGWEGIGKYIYMTENSSGALGCWTNNFDYPWNEYDKDFYAEHFEEFLSYLDEADKGAKDSLQRSHVETFRVIVTFLGLSSTYERDWLDGTDESQAAYRERYEWLWNWCRNHRGKLMLNSTFIADETKVCGMWNFPSNADKPCDPMNWLLGDDWFGKR